jgi:predicted nucleic acid-binding protein
MKLGDALCGVALLGLDTAPLIYLIEDHPRYAPLVNEVAERMASGQIVAVTSVVSLAEVMVQPFARGDRYLQQRFRSLLLNSDEVRTIPVDASMAERAAELRARYRIKLPDAIQVAAAISEGCEVFLTNDRRLAQVAEIRVLVLDDLELS